MNWLKKVMYGRYGIDKLSRALIVLSFILLMMERLLPKSLSGLIVISYVPIAIYIFRVFSKDIYKRQQENNKYLKIENCVVIWFKQKLNRAKDSKLINILHAQIANKN